MNQGQQLFSFCTPALWMQIINSSVEQRSHHFTEVLSIVSIWVQSSLNYLTPLKGIFQCAIVLLLTAPLYLLDKMRPVLIRILSSFFLILVVMETGQLFQINIWFEVKLGLIRLTVSLSALCTSLSRQGFKATVFIHETLFCCIRNHPELMVGGAISSADAHVFKQSLWTYHCITWWFLSN